MGALLRPKGSDASIYVCHSHCIPSGCLSSIPDGLAACGRPPEFLAIRECPDLAEKLCLQHPSILMEVGEEPRSLIPSLVLFLCGSDRSMIRHRLSGLLFLGIDMIELSVATGREWTQDSAFDPFVI